MAVNERLGQLSKVATTRRVIVEIDGKRKIVEAPRDMSNEDIQRDLERQASAPKQPSAQAKKGSTGLRSLLSGAADMFSFGAADEVGAALGVLGYGPEGTKSIWSGKGSIADKWRSNQKMLEEQLKADQQINPGMSLLGAAGGAVVPALMTGGAAVAPRVAQGGRIARTASRVAPVAAQGAAYGFNSGSGGIAERAKEIPEGVAWAVGGNEVGRLLGRGASRLIGGQKVSPAVRKLADEGVTLTPGQRAGTRSLRNVFEDKVLGSIPLVSDVPAAARERGVNDLRVAVANRVLAPIGGNVPRGTQINNAAIGGLQDTVYNTLDDAASALSLQMDEPLEQGFQQVTSSAPRLLGGEGAQQIGAYADHLRDRLSRGPVTGPVLREMLGEIRGVASSTPGQAGQQLWALHDELAGAMTRQNPSTASSAFANARESAALLKRLEDAASRPGVTNGEFGPTQLLSAAKRRGFGTTTGNVASGEARLMDLANAAADVMRNTTANSGTVPRAIAGGGLMAGATGGAAMVDPTMGAVTLASLLGYVPGADRALQNLALNRPGEAIALSEAIRRNLPALGAAGTGTALSVSGQ